MSVVPESEIRKKLPYMTEEFYALASYFAQALGEKPSPMAIPVVMAGVIDDVERGVCGFAKKLDFPDIFIKRKVYVESELPNLVYYVDAFLPEGSDMFREMLCSAMHWDIPKLKTAKFADHVPENIRVAAEWWLQQIQHPRMDNGEPKMLEFVARMGGGIRARPTDDEVEKFTAIFVNKLSVALASRPEVELRVDYFPWDNILATVENELRFGQFAWPCKTNMIVSKDCIKVSVGSGAEWKTIWAS